MQFRDLPTHDGTRQGRELRTMLHLHSRACCRQIGCPALPAAHPPIKKRKKKLFLALLVLA
jgi:hypothetical protein